MREASLPRLGRKRTALMVVLALIAMIAAWYRGGERALRPIEQDISVPAGVL